MINNVGESPALRGWYANLFRSIRGCGVHYVEDSIVSIILQTLSFIDAFRKQRLAVNEFQHAITFFPLTNILSLLGVYLFQLISS